MILEKHIPIISEKHGSLSVRIAGINSINALVPIFSSKSSKNFTTFWEVGFLIISIKVKWTSGKINDKIALLSVFIEPRKSSCQTLTLGLLWIKAR